MIQGKVTATAANEVLAYVRERGLNVKWILETHAHADHLSASQYLKKTLGGSAHIAIGEGIIQVQQTFSKLFALPSDALKANGADFDHLFKASEPIQLGAIQGKALHVPGHTPDHICYLLGDAVFVGDTIFMPDSGSARCDFPGGSATQLFHSVRQVLFSLADSTRIFVGHDYQPGNRALIFETTVAQEKEANSHLKLSVSEAEFIKMREDRDKTLSNPKLLFPALQVNIRAGKLPTARSQLFPDRRLFVTPVDASGFDLE